jgi:hypothetical protein
LPHAAVPALQRMSVASEMMNTSESSTPPGTPTFTISLANPMLFAAAPFASGEPIVTLFDVCTGGLQDGNTSGGPCVRLGVPHAWYDGTNGT